MPIKLTCHCDICGKEMTGLGSKYQENKLSEDNQPDLSLIGTKYNVICIHCRNTIRETIKNLTHTNQADATALERLEPSKNSVLSPTSISTNAKKWSGAG